MYMLQFREAASIDYLVFVCVCVWASSASLTDGKIMRDGGPEFVGRGNNVCYGQFDLVGWVDKNKLYTEVPCLFCSSRLMHE